MRRPHAIVLALVSTACVGACSPAGLPLASSPAPPPPASGQLETGAVSNTTPGAGYETATIVPGTPTEVYARVASGALRCWFGANGPLKATHIFQAEAAPPSQGGVTEIVLHERDVSLRDQRGARAFRVSFVGEGGNVQVGIATLKVAAPMAEPMVKDVEAWAQGDAGCRVRALSPPVEAAAPPKKTAKTKGSQDSRR